MRTRVPICGTGSISAYRSWSDEVNVEEQWDVRGERMTVYIYLKINSLEHENA
jgi:hypothetical protein